MTYIDAKQILSVLLALSLRSISHGLTALIAFDRCRIIRAPFKARAAASSARRTVQLMILRFDFIRIILFD